MLIEGFGSATPYWDQWDSEADRLYRPWLTGRFDWSVLLVPHNEHRILTERLLALALLELNGKIWDPLLQMLVNALLHVSAWLVLLRLLLSALGEGQRLIVTAFTAVVLAIPFGWENTLWGAQSEIYFLLLFAFLSLWWVTVNVPFTRGWWLGLGAGVLAFFSLASGALTFAVAGAMILIRWLLGVERRQGMWQALLLLMTLFLVAVLVTPSIPHHDTLRVTSFLGLLQAFSKWIGWPNRGLLVGLLLYAPAVLLLWRQIRVRPAMGDGSWFLVALSLWSVAQIVLMILGRGAAPIPSRYQDVMVVGILTNFVGLVLLWGEQGRVRVYYSLLGLVWVAAVAMGVLGRMPKIDAGVMDRKQTSQAQEQNVRNYLSTGDVSFLQDKPYLHVPYPQTEHLRVLLDDETVRRILPSSLVPGARPGRLEGLRTVTLSAGGILVGMGLGSFRLALVRLRTSLPGKDEG